MKVSRKQIALAISLFIFSIIVVHVSSDRTKFNESRNIMLPPEAILDEHCFPVLSVNGKVGFIASVTTGSVMSFNTTSGRIMSSIIVGETAGAIALVETDSGRLLAVPTANDPDHDKPGSIAIIDATKPKELQIVTLIILPKTAHITPSTPVFLTSDAHYGIIASSFPEPTLYSFSTATGQIISQLAILGQPSEIAMRCLRQNSLIAIASAAANILSFINLDANGLLNQVSFFSPDKARISESNNPVIDINGRIAYIAASDGEMLFSIDIASGAPISGLKVSSTPQRISIARNQNREELIAITRTRNTEKNQSGGVLIALSLRGQLITKANFEPPDQIDFSSVNNVVFGEDAALAFVSSKSGFLFAFNTETGELNSHQFLGNELMSIAISNAIKKVIAIKRNASQDAITITDFEISSANEPGEDQLKSNVQAFHNTAVNSSNLSEKISSRLDKKLNGSHDLPKVIMLDANGKQFAIDTSRVHFRSSKTLEIALDGKLTQLIERGGWKFNIRNDQSTVSSVNTVDATIPKVPCQINRAYIKPSKNLNGILRLIVTGTGFQEENVVEFVKTGAVIYRQLANSVTQDTLLVKISEYEYRSFGQFRVRIINSSKLPSNLIDVEPLKIHFSLEEDIRPAYASGEFTLQSLATVDSVNAKSIGKGVQVIVNSNAYLNYSDFTLANPSRIVIDIQDARTIFGYKTFNLNSPNLHLSRIRVGQPSKGVVRIVLDLTKKTSYKITRDSGRLIIITD